jgi:glutamate dehydrogenase (NADP+)
VEEYLKSIGDSYKGKKVSVSGSGNVAIFATEKVFQLGGKVVTMTDSNGYIYDENGIDLDLIKEIKLVKRGRLADYAKAKKGVTYVEVGKGKVWDVAVDIALPCATQNELDLKDAKELVKNGVKIVGEGANMPSTQEAADYFLEKKITFVPGKASNAGGVATSALEMSQNSSRTSWTFEEVDSKLKGIMVNIFHSIDDASKEYNMEGNYIAGANIAGFKKVAAAMLAQGIV